MSSGPQLLGSCGGDGSKGCYQLCLNLEKQSPAAVRMSWGYTAWSHFQKQNLGGKVGISGGPFLRRGEQKSLGAKHTDYIESSRAEGQTHHTPARETSNGRGETQGTSLSLSGTPGQRNQQCPQKALGGGFASLLQPGPENRMKKSLCHYNLSISSLMVQGLRWSNTYHLKEEASRRIYPHPSW